MLIKLQIILLSRLDLIEPQQKAKKKSPCTRLSVLQMDLQII